MAITGTKLFWGRLASERLHNDYSIIVDRTLFLKYLLEQPSKIMSFAFPPRFGKSFLLSITKSFFTCKRKEQIDTFFRESLMKKTDPELFEKHYGEYIIVSLTLNLSNRTCNDEVKRELGGDILHAFSWMEELDDAELETMQEAVYVRNSTVDAWSNMFIDFLRKISQRTGKQCIILIDEMDMIFQTLGHGESDKMYKLLHKVMFDGLLNEPCVFKVIVTGIIHLDWNKLVGEETVSQNNAIGTRVALKDFRNKDFLEWIGLSHEEVMTLQTMLKRKWNFEDFGYVYNKDKAVRFPWICVDDDLLQCYYNMGFPTHILENLAEHLKQEGRQSEFSALYKDVVYLRSCRNHWLSRTLYPWVDFDAVREILYIFGHYYSLLGL